MKLSNRLQQMQESPIRKLVPLAEEAKKSGKKVYHLNIGQPDIETSKVFMDAIRTFEEPVIKYSFSKGDPQLIDAMVAYYQSMGANFTADDILIMNGGSEAILFALIAIGDEGDHILVPEPFYTNYNGFSIPVNVKIDPITTYANNGFSLPSYEEMAALVHKKTKAILLSNPGNPTGAVYTKDEVQRIVRLAKSFDLFIIADEVYREFVYDDFDYTSFATQKDVEDRVIIVDSISKRFSACGARIGSLASKNQEFIKGVLKLCMGRLCVPTLEQIGATALYRMDTAYFEPIREEYKKRRDIVYHALKKIDGIICEKPQGAFYVIAKLPIKNAEDFVRWMLESYEDQGETVMLAPAENFYSTPEMGRDEIRIAYILNTDELTRAMEIFTKGLQAYQAKE